MLDYIDGFLRLLGIIAIPYSGILLGQIVVGVAAEPGKHGGHIRHRDDPSGFWKLIRQQILWIMGGCAALALLFSFKG